MRIQEYGCFKTDFDTLTAALRTLPVERSPWNDIYQSDIGIQFQKGLEHFWDKVPTGDGGGGLRAYPKCTSVVCWTPSSRYPP
jgi:hypothetical protein